MSRELTEPDARTHVDDVWLTDLTMGVCLLRWRVPMLNTMVTVDWNSYLPTSPLSRVVQVFDTVVRGSLG